jgi:N-acetyl-gamma-glutamyl-phosphate reductase
MRPDMRIISLRPIPGVNQEMSGVVYGLPEINRKLMVRGATCSFLPSPFASMALVALYPLALNLLLNDNIKISLKAPADILEEYNVEKSAAEIEEKLSKVQQSFNGEVEISSAPSATRRSAMMEISLGCNLDAEHVMKLYEMYDDHNFAFAVRSAVGASEVAGTDKCVISVGTPTDGQLTLSVVADCRLRGGAGEAVHVMNLMFGLHERTGLALKAIDFNPVDHNIHPEIEEECS